MKTFLQWILVCALLCKCYCDEECKRALCDKCKRTVFEVPNVIKNIEAKGEIYDPVTIAKRIYCKKIRKDRRCLNKLCSKMDKVIERIKKDQDPEKICKYIALC